MGILKWLFGKNDKAISKKDDKRLSPIEKEIRRKLKEVYDALERRPDEIENIKRLYYKALAQWKVNFGKMKDKDYLNSQRQLIERKMEEIENRNKFPFGRRGKERKKAA